MWDKYGPNCIKSEFRFCFIIFWERKNIYGNDIPVVTIGKNFRNKTEHFYRKLISMIPGNTHFLNQILNLTLDESI